MLDLETLPQSASKMPDTINGTVMFQYGDLFIVEQSKVRRAIFNETQVEYDLEPSADNTRFTARRRKF